MKEKLSDAWDSIKKFLIFTVLILFFIVIAIVCFYNCGLQAKKQNAIDGGVTATAKIVKVESHSSYSSYMKSTNTEFLTIYEYIDVDGTIYSGIAQSGYNTEIEAKKNIGAEIEIYIDGKGNSIRVGEKTNFTTLLIVGIIAIIICLAVVAFIIWAKMPFIRKRFNKSNTPIFIQPKDNKEDK